MTFNEAASPAPGATPATVFNVQALRALAAMIVVCLHLQEVLALLGLPAPAGGVELFFVISGFIMVFTTQGRPITASRFLAKRLARIAPIYWLFTLFVFGCALVAPQLFKNTHPVLADLLLSLSFIPFAKDGIHAQPLLFVGWTLNYEMFFYLLFAAGLAMGGRSRGAAVAAVLSVLFLVGLFAPPTGLIAAFYTQAYILLFALGIVVARLPLARFTNAPVVLVLAALVAAVPMLFGALIWPNIHPALTAGPAAAVVVYAAVSLERLGYRVRNRTILRLGDASYAIYLSHPFVVLPIDKLVRHMPHSALFAVAAVIGGLAATAIVGWLIHSRIERPLTRFAQALLIRSPAAPLLARSEIRARGRDLPTPPPGA